MAKRNKTSKPAAPKVKAVPGVEPFKPKYELIDENPAERHSANPPGYKYVLARWKDQNKKERKDIVILPVDEVEKLKRQK